MKKILVACLLLCACASPPPKPALGEPTATGQRELEVLVGVMTGTWDARPGTPPIRLRIVEFWKGTKNDHWVYLEWSRPGTDRPVRQRIYRLSEGSGRIVAQAFLPRQDPSAYAGEWRKAAPFASASPGDLRLLEGCDVLFEYKNATIYSAGTLAKSCRGDRPGVSGERSEFLFTYSEARNLEQGFDLSGTGIPSESEPYDLLKSSREML